MLYKDQAQDQKLSPFDDHSVMLSTFKLFNYFGDRRDEILFASDSPWSVD